MSELSMALRRLEIGVEARVEAVLPVDEAAALLTERNRLVSLAAGTPTPLCEDRWDAGVICSLPADHAGWHASNPWYDADRQDVHAGQTWIPRRAGSDFRMCRS